MGDERRLSPCLTRMSHHGKVESQQLFLLCLTDIPIKCLGQSGCLWAAPVAGRPKREVGGTSPAAPGVSTCTCLGTAALFSVRELARGGGTPTNWDAPIVFEE